MEYLSCLTNASRDIFTESIMKVNKGRCQNRRKIKINKNHITKTRTHELILLSLTVLYLV